MEDDEIFETIVHAKKNFGIRCSKFAGTVTVEIIKRALEKSGIRTSSRDVFIKGVPIEIDLLVPRTGAVADYDIVYEPQDVLIVLEIKSAGAFGESTIKSVKKRFQRIREINQKIYCAYVTLAERIGYRWAISEEKTGFPSYTLFWHSGSGGNFTIESKGDWHKLLEDMSKVVAGDRSAAIG